MENKTPDQIKLNILIEKGGGKLFSLSEREIIFAAMEEYAAQFKSDPGSEEGEWKGDSYMRSEKERQIILMRALGVNYPESGATFEQCINTVIFLAGDFKTKLEQLLSHQPAQPSRQWTDEEIEKMALSEYPVVMKREYLDTGYFTYDNNKFDREVFIKGFKSAIQKQKQGL